MKNRLKKEKDLEDNLERCLVLPGEEKKFWLARIKTLPDSILENVLKSVSAKNKIVDSYIAAAIKKNKKHDYVAELKATVVDIQQKAFDLESKSEAQASEEDLEKQIQNL
jgi:hypothetical protein